MFFRGKKGDMSSAGFLEADDIKSGGILFYN